jgi:hypothetical protein
MSDEIKNPFDNDIDDEENNQEDEQSEEIIRKLSINEEEEEEANEPPLSTPNGRESPSAASFSDVIIEKEDKSPPFVSEENHPNDLLQIISEKSNKEATSTILNTVLKKNILFFELIFLNFFLLACQWRFRFRQKLYYSKTSKFI